MDLTISGERCRVHRNDRAAQSLEEGASLIHLQGVSDTGKHNWNSDDHDGESDNVKMGSSSSIAMVERHDARALLDEMALEQICNHSCANTASIDTGISTANSKQHLSHQPLGDEEGTEEEIAERNFARYGGLGSEYSSCFLLKGEEKPSDGKPTSRWGARLSSGRKRSSSLNSEDGDSTVQEEQNNSQGEGKPFELSEEQLKGLPLDIALPKSARQNTIIEHTASRIASNSQLEVFLKVKQADNKDFSFLSPSDELHQYFQCVKKRYGSKANASKEEGMSDDSDASAGCNPLSGLLGGYSSSSDESSGSTKGDSKDCAGSHAKEDNSNEVDVTARVEADEKDDTLSEERDRKRKADRLERLRIWKEAKLKENDKK